MRMTQRPRRPALGSCSPVASILYHSNSAYSFARILRERHGGLPAPRVQGAIRHATLSLSGQHASTKASFVAATRDLSLVAMLKDPFALTPRFEGPKQPAGNKIAFDEDLNSWSAPFPMSTINTRNVHRSNMLMGFSYGKDFVYDEMISTGQGEQGRAKAKLVMAATNKLSGTEGPKPGEGPSKEERESGSYISFSLHSQPMAGNCAPLSLVIANRAMPRRQK